MTRVKLIKKVVKTKGAPAYMVSFGDMMTLILCFFILLVAMAKEQNFGLVAKGLGSFVISLRSFGLTGILDENEKQAIHDEVRRRFNLPPEEDPERRADPLEATPFELVRAETLEALEPRRELRMPSIATFSDLETELDDADRAFLDSQADSLRPAAGQSLLLEGHAPPRGARVGDATWMAFRRAAAVREYLVQRHRFDESRVEARAWLREIDDDPRMTNVVHARLVLPDRNTEENR